MESVAAGQGTATNRGGSNRILSTTQNDLRPDWLTEVFQCAQLGSYPSKTQKFVRDGEASLFFNIIISVVPEEKLILRMFFLKRVVWKNTTVFYRKDVFNLFVS